MLLKGARFSASYWYLHVEALARNGPAYAIDTPGDPNPSVARAPLTPPASCVAWLDELLAQLSGDRPVHLVGLSWDGWAAMNQAIRAPARAASITLSGPAGLTKLDTRFWWRQRTPVPAQRRGPSRPVQGIASPWLARAVATRAMQARKSPGQPNTRVRHSRASFHSRPALARPLSTARKLPMSPPAPFRDRCNRRW